MNKKLHRVIFNKTRGLLMAVSEIGRSHGAGNSVQMGQGTAPPLAMARMSPIAFAVLALTGAQMFCMNAARAQIVADPSAPKTQQPVIVNTANGLPQVNIATPSAAGVSRNTYSQFDVNKPGAILNNARNDVQTQLGGWVQRNPNLANGTARIILNEVNSSNPSMLRGYVEVAGDRAQVIIANPSGVTCDGCGFINASRSTLTTGTAIINNGALDGYLVRGGVVAVQGDGMDASRSDFTDIIARATRINAGIWSKELRVTSGSNRVDADNARADRQAAADAAPAFGIDVAQLGGMYANKIVLVGTEAGVGMRNAGNIGAAAGEVRISADGRIENSGRIAGSQALSVSAAGIDNRNARIQSGGDMRLDVGAGAIDNTGGLIESSTALSVRAANVVNADTGRSDQGLHGNTIAVDADAIDNRRGSMLATDALAVTSAGALDNGAGAISAGGALSIADRKAGTTSTGRSLVVTNTGGKIDAGTTAVIDGAVLTGDGQLLSRRATNVKLIQDFTNTGTVRGDGTVAIESAGTITNRGTLRSADALNLKAATIANDAAGAIVANKLSLNATDAHTLVNRGLIDGQDTFIDTQTLRNLGTGRIYGDHVAIAAATIDNEAETVNGITSAPVIAARNRMDIGAATINNREHAMLFSGGDMVIGGALDGAHRATGQAGTINNNSATIEALGALDLSAKTINNTNEHFRTEIVEISRSSHREFQYSGSATRYDDSQIAIINDEADDMWVRDANGNPSIKLGNDFNRYDFTRVVTESRITETDPAKISAGGAMRITADTVNNDKSQIMAGGAINGAIGVLNNTEVPGQHIITDSGTAYHFYNIEKKGRDEQGVSSTGYYPGAVVQAISLTPTVYRQNMAVSGSGTQVAALSNGRMNSLVSVPNNSLFSVNINPAIGYLVQSDPRFTNYRNWLSSDYMLQQLNVDPTLTQKRLGDGFYEQKLVREQVAELTGKRFLDGYATDEAQYRALLDAGVTVARQYNLKVGVELTAEQVAKLTTDVVLLVEKDVTLPDGSITRALVPQLYVRLKDGDINGSGALLSADSINLQLTGDANNSGTIAGRSLVSINAENINNIGGRITAKDAIVKASLDVNNLGGAIDGGDSLTVNAGRDLNLVSTTSDSATSQATRTSVERVAALYVANPNATLVASAGRDINLNAAQIANSGAGGTTTLAASRNINIGTVTERSTQALTWDADNKRQDASQIDVGSRIMTVGDLRITAGKDVSARAADITSELGGISIAAGNDVTLGAGEAHQTVDERHKSQGNNSWLSKKTITTHDTADLTDKIGSNVSGKNIAIQAGHDVHVEGSNVVSNDAASILAVNDINIQAATSSSITSHRRDEVKSGIFSGGGLGFTIGKQQKTDQTDATSVTQSQSRSTIGSISGSISVIAGNNLAMAGSDAIAAQDINLAGKNVSLLPGQDQTHVVETHEFKKSGLTIALTGGMADAAQSIQQSVQRAGQVKDKRLAGLYGVKAAQTAYQSMGTAQNVMAAQSADGAAQSSGIKLSISVGGSQAKNVNTTDSIANAGSTATAGGSLNVVATDGDIRLQGSSLDGKDILLSAAKNIDISAATDATSNKAENSSASASVGVFIGYDSKGSKGIGFEASGSIAQGKTNSDTTADKETQITASNSLTIASGQDTNIKGGQLRADQIKAIIGRNLNIASTQDTDTYRDKQQSAAISGSIGLGSGSLSLQLSDSRTRSDYRSVKEQSGFFTGQGGYDIQVGSNTDLKGAVVASAASADKNKFSTGTLTTSDIDNKADYKSQTISIGIGTGSGPGVGNVGGGPGQKPGGLGFGSTGGSASGTTRSAISNGSITIRDETGQQHVAGKTVEQTVASINRDTQNANGSIQRIFDKQAVDETLELARLTGELGYKAAADIAQKKGDDIRKAAVEAEKAGDAGRAQQLWNEAKEWDEGGTRRTWLHAAVGAAQGGIQGGFSNAAAAAGGAVAGHLAGKAVQGAVTAALGSKDKDGNTVANAGSNLVTNIIASGVGMAAGGALSGSSVGALQGAGAGSDVDKFNRQLHPTEIAWIQQNAKRFAIEQGITDNEAEKRLAQQGFRQVQNGAGGSEDSAARAFLSTVKGMLPADGNSGPGYMFFATPDQKGNITMYANAVINDPASLSFYQKNGIQQPTQQQIIDSLSKEAGIRGAVAKATLGAGALALATTLPPALSFCLSNPVACNQVAISGAEIIGGDALGPSGLAIGGAVAARQGLKSVQSAEQVNAQMVKNGMDAAWAAGTPVVNAELKVGTKVQMVITEEAYQKFKLDPSRSPIGGWATFDSVESQLAARQDLALLSKYKPDTKYIIELEVIKPIDANIGYVGEQIEKNGTLLRGGKTQAQFNWNAVGNPKDRTEYLKIIGEPQKLERTK
ncbi:hemagglutinin repeat-containing protein [Herbaspirillum robiniae]|uniref:two-partner secretion domain-containing protein n=1 Tax=Herbaspirillum robiniae TaxID=2014887 RepID=UPI003D781EFF